MSIAGDKAGQKNHLMITWGIELSHRDDNSHSLKVEGKTEATMRAIQPQDYSWRENIKKKTSKNLPRIAKWVTFVDVKSVKPFKGNVLKEDPVDRLVSTDVMTAGNGKLIPVHQAPPEDGHGFWPTGGSY